MKDISRSAIVLMLCTAIGAQAAVLQGPEVLPLDLEQMLSGSRPAPEQVAYGISYAMDLETKGSWTEADGWSDWSYAIEIPGALSLAFHAAGRLPEGATLELAGAEGMAIKRYGAGEIATMGSFTSVLVPGDLLRLHLHVPADRRNAARLHADTLYVGFRPSPLARGAGAFEPHATSGPALVNWSCVLSAATELAGDATVLYTVSASNPGGNGPGLSQCTGTLLNDVPQDGRLYMLTAAHCGQTNWDAGSITVYWNRVSSCPVGLQDAMNVPGPTTSGATTRALFATGGIDHEDQWLVELNSSGIPSGSQAVFAGWDASDVTALPDGGPQEVFGINHGKDLAKQYTASINGPSNVPSPEEVTYTWTQGQTQDGASGSGAFESSQRLFGTLSSGVIDANGNAESGYQILAASWRGDGGTNAPASSTGAWLDPSNTGALQLDAMMPPSAPNVSITLNHESVTVGQSYTLTWSSEGASTCTAGGAWNGNQSLSGSLSVTAAASGDYSYALTCTNAGGSTSASATEVVNAATGSSSGSAPAGGGGGAISPTVGCGLMACVALRRKHRRRRRP